MALWGTHARARASPIILWLLRWLCFRISLGAGLIKMRGGSCWAARTCLWYHFETQPIPSPLSFIFHFLPKPVLSWAVDLDVFVQFYSSWLVLLPGVLLPLRALRRLGGFIQAGFMVNIACSGNLAFLNHLTLVPCLAALDDSCWPRSLHRGQQPRRPSAHRSLDTFGRLSRGALDVSLLAMIAYLSWPVVENLLQLGGTRQVMNRSFGSLRLVNTYGAFGSVGEARYEPIVQFSSTGHPGDWWELELPWAYLLTYLLTYLLAYLLTYLLRWELELPCKPGNVTRRPCFCAPYHYRLDWNIWFLGFKPHAHMLRQRESWLYALIAKLLEGDQGPYALLDASSVAKLASLQTPPRFAKVDMFRYTMAAPLHTLGLEWLRAEAPVVWWRREFEETLIPVMTLGADGRLQPAARHL